MVSVLITLVGSISVISAAPQFDFNNGQPTPYSFSYGVNSPETGDVKEHKERVSPAGVTEGEYRWLQPNGLFRVTRYTVDNGGYRAVVSEEAGEPVTTYYTNSLLGPNSPQGSLVSGFQSNNLGSSSFQSSNRGSNSRQNFQNQGFTNLGNFQNQDFTSSGNFQNQGSTGFQNQDFTSTFSSTPNFQNQESANFQFQGFLNPQNIFPQRSSNGQSFQSQGFTGLPDFQNQGNVINGRFIDGGVIDNTFTTFSSASNRLGSNPNNFNSNSDNFQPSFNSLNRPGNRRSAVVLGSNQNRFFI